MQGIFIQYNHSGQSYLEEFRILCQTKLAYNSRFGQRNAANMIIMIIAYTVLSETRQMSLSTSSPLRQSRSHIILTFIKIIFIFRSHLGSDQIARVILTSVLSNYNWGSGEIHNIADNSMYRSEIGV